MTSSNALWAELWGVLSGIQLARDLNLKKFIIESDSKMVVEAILWGSFPNPSVQCLLDEILLMFHRRDWEMEVAHILISTNRCADAYACLGYSGCFAISLVDRPWPLLELLLRDDILGNCSYSFFVL